MSQDNVQVVRAAIQAWSRGDWVTALEYGTLDFEIDLSRARGPLRGVYAREQADATWRDLTEGMTSALIEPHEFIEMGEHVVVPWTFRVVGRDGIEVEARTTWLFTLRGRKIERVCMYQGRAEALEAAGLPE
jgi:ketosteroid isomerase-like protein